VNRITLESATGRRGSGVVVNGKENKQKDQHIQILRLIGN